MLTVGRLPELRPRIGRSGRLRVTTVPDCARLTGGLSGRSGWLPVTWQRLMEPGLPILDMPRSAGIDSGRCAAAGSGASAAGVIAAYAAAIVAFAYALVSLSWAVGGRGLVGAVGGFVEQLARRGGGALVLLALVAVAATAVGGLIALALVRPWSRVVRRRLLLIISAAASALLIVYGGLNVAAGALVLSGVLHPSGSVNRTALRWHVGVWDLWFLVWGILLAVATVAFWRRTGRRSD